MVTHADIIERLGGQSYVGRKLGRDQSTICRWAQNGIPPHAYDAVLRLAARRGITLTLRELAASNPRFGRHGTARNTIRLTGRSPAAALVS
jgi:hypothetical protein